ncbi:MAG: hypothetical protein JWM11_3135 [Planctomycetaceae bacterium]|nr:hypothetical protein [Planctomycetaceae bacterium]
MKRLIKTLTVLTAVLFSSTTFAAEPVGFDASVLPLFKTYCLRCHDSQKQEGKFRLDTLPREFVDQATAQRWGEVVFRMNSGEMPPKKEPQPKAEELGKAVDWISARIKEGEAARMAKRGPVAHYRLSRDEYANSIYDLLGVYFDVNQPGVFNEDPRWHGFDRIGSLLSLSPSHVDRYFRAAESVLDLAFPAQQAKSAIVRRDANQGHEKWLAEQKIKENVRWQLFPGRRLHLMNISHPGNYRVRIQLSGMQPPQGPAPHLSIWNQQLKKSIFDQDVFAPETKPVIVEFEAALSPGGFNLVNEVSGAFPQEGDGDHTANVTHGGGSIFTSTRDMRRINPTGYMLFTDKGEAMYPMLLVDWIEWEGPIVTAEDQKKRDGVFPASLAAKEVNWNEVRTCLKQFATRAWRRPATDSETERYVKIVENEIKAGETADTAYRSALVAVLTSKNFYYLEEGSANEKRTTVNDWELASRMSYFLWSSMPDAELIAAAQSGTLVKPDALRGQLGRMLADSKSKRFTEAFPRQWLQLHRLGMFPPDPGLYREYDKWLEKSMTLETLEFFNEVYSKNLSLREFLVSDWTMVNSRLAVHYKLPQPVPPLSTQSGFQKFKLRPDDHRGGLLTQASILSLTSDGTRHRPVHRGVWVSEAIFGRTPPPPPPNVEPLAPTPSDKPKATIRMQLDAHATHATCASCHQKIDPLGFAFENFDAIGGWRTEERVAAGQGANPPVNSNGTLPTGQTFQGPDEFKQLLAQDLDRFAEAFVEQLATYALRRVMTIDDAAQIKAIAVASKPDGYKLRTVIENLVLSDLFQKR